jgi:hypothetical protein
MTWPKSVSCFSVNIEILKKTSEPSQDEAIALSRNFENLLPFDLAVYH